MRVDDPDHPTILENLLRAIGAEPVPHERNLLCCGRACMDDKIPDAMVIDIIESIQKSGADCMGLICPSCFDEFDMGQIIRGRKHKKQLDVPVVYYFQLLGLAQGFTVEQVGLNMHKVKADRLFEKLAVEA
jgi:heterodisulfide reductase subunit B